MTLHEFHFEREKSFFTSEDGILEKYKIVNAFLKKYNWLFLSPFFLQGFEVDLLYDLSKKEGDHKNEVLRIIYRKFYNLSHTASFLQGYCNRCSHIEPFLISIEHSLILAFQRDYEGSIKTLIPVVEGILRKYILTEHPLKKITFKVLRDSFSDLESGIIRKYEIHLLSYRDGNNIPVNFTVEERTILINFQVQRFSTWFSFVKDFIDNSFYLKTENGKKTYGLNRHDILHQLSSDATYNLENYIKVYFIIQFLTWIFLIDENKSTLSEAAGIRYAEKIFAYENIILKSRELYQSKKILYKDYENNSPSIFDEELHISIIERETLYNTMSKYNKAKKIRAFLKNLLKN